MFLYLKLAGSKIPSVFFGPRFFQMTRYPVSKELKIPWSLLVIKMKGEHDPFSKDKNYSRLSCHFWDVYCLESIAFAVHRDQKWEWRTTWANLGSRIWATNKNQVELRFFLMLHLCWVFWNQWRSDHLSPSPIGHVAFLRYVWSNVFHLRTEV